ncbi:hypothetical protein F5888DRAFT_418349 [Russula emetica]|nr:hypothetical protein F5888DRAFT_418349 [Russula emetica]
MPSSIKPSAALCLALALSSGQRALAVNDWSVPCTQGTCSWDLPAESGSSGSVNIWGPVGAISDITPANGWEITTECHPTSSKQDIQLICKDNNPDCNHLFQGNGAVNTIVRLSESCGPTPFARVVQHQIIQSNLSTGGNGSEAPVHRLTLDTDFAAASPSHGGEVHFSVQGQKAPDYSNAVNRRSRSLARSQNQIHRRANTFGPDNVHGSASVNYSGHNNLFSNGSGSIDLYTDLQGSVNISAVASGTMVPLNVTQFEIIFVLDGNADANLSFSGDFSGSVNSGNVTLFQSNLSIPDLHIPDILDISPEFTLLGSIDANFGFTNVNATVEVNYDFGNSSFVFPPQNGSNVDHISSSSKQVTFSANNGSTLDASTHFIPQIFLGISVLGSAHASVFLDFDASLGLQGSISSAKASKQQPCLAANADINVSVGAQGSFFDLYNSSTNGSVIDKNFTLFQKCFGANGNPSSAPAATAAGAYWILSLMLACTLTYSLLSD